MTQYQPINIPKLSEIKDMEPYSGYVKSVNIYNRAYSHKELDRLLKPKRKGTIRTYLFCLGIAIFIYSLAEILTM